MELKTSVLDENCKIVSSIALGVRKWSSSILKFFKKSTFIWGPKQNNIGVSIGHKNIIVVEIDRTEEIPRLVKFAVKELDANNDPATILKDIFSQQNFSNPFIITSLSGKSVIVRFIKFPKMNKKDLRSALLFESEKYIPFDVDQVYLDFYVLNEQGDQKYFDIALVVAKKDSVDDLIKLAGTAGFNVKTIDIDTFACCNTFLLSYPDEIANTVALLNIGAKLTNLTVVSKGVPAFCRDIYYGGDDITVALSKKLHIEEALAGKMKFNIKEADVENIESVIREILNYLITEIKLSLDYFLKQAQIKNIAQIYITGGSSKLEGIQAILQEALGANVCDLDPLRAVVIDESVDCDLLNKYTASLAVPIGLALRK